MPAATAFEACSILIRCLYDQEKSFKGLSRCQAAKLTTKNVPKDPTPQLALLSHELQER